MLQLHGDASACSTVCRTVDLGELSSESAGSDWRDTLKGRKRRTDATPIGFGSKSEKSSSMLRMGPRTVNPRLEDREIPGEGGGRT